MKVYAISDLHLSGNNPKPMDIFGSTWANYMEEITADWAQRVKADDIVLIAGDISWAMNLADAATDLHTLCALPGSKVIIRGNHDYWWKAIGAVRASLSGNAYAVQNDALRLGNFVICGSRGWTTPESGAAQTSEDKKIYDREVQRMTLSLQAAKRLIKEGDKLIAMIHYPPFNSRHESSLFTGLFEEYGVDAVVYGHLHGNPGRLCLYKEMGGISYSLTSCDLVKNKLIEIF